MSDSNDVVQQSQPTADKCRPDQLHFQMTWIDCDCDDDVVEYGYDACDDGDDAGDDEGCGGAFHWTGIHHCPRSTSLIIFALKTILLGGVFGAKVVI